MSKRRKKSPRRAKRSASMCGPRMVLSMLGEAVELTYRHIDGRKMRHPFNKGVKLGFVGSAIVITPVSVKPFIEG